MEGFFDPYERSCSLPALPIVASLVLSRSPPSLTFTLYPIPPQPTYDHPPPSLPKAISCLSLSAAHHATLIQLNAQQFLALVLERRWALRDNYHSLGPRYFAEAQGYAARALWNLRLSVGIWRGEREEGGGGVAGGEVWVDKRRDDVFILILTGFLIIIHHN